MFSLWHRTPPRGAEAERMKLFERVTQPQVVALSVICAVGAQRGWFTACGVIWTLFMATVRKTESPPLFQLSCSPTKRERPCSSHSMLSMVLEHRVGHKPQIAHYLSCVIIRLAGARSLNTSWRSYYWCNSLLRDTSLAWRTEARIWVKITSDPFSCLQESDAKKIIEFRARQNKRIDMHGMQYRITCAQLSAMQVAQRPERWL